MTATPSPLPGILVIVHPGTACGSAGFNLGRYEARAAREFLAADIAEWRGAVAVVDGFLSDELRLYRRLREAVEGAVERAGRFGARVWACDAEGMTSEAAGIVAERLGLVPGQWDVQVTGCWYDESDASGCVNSVRRAFEDMGFSASVRDSAIAMPEVEPDESPALGR